MTTARATVMPAHQPVEDGRERPYGAGIHVLLAENAATKAWTAGTSPAMAPEG
jgi:hypothetical protein